MADRIGVDGLFGKYKLQYVETPPCRKCKNKVCMTDKSKCKDLVRFIKTIRG